MNGVAARRRALPTGVWGVILLIATEATLFGTLLASYFYLRLRVVDWPPPGVPRPSVTLPLVLTAALVATSAPIVLAVRAARRGDARAAWLLLAVALAVQGAYLGVQLHLFLSDLDKLAPDRTAYASIYFTLLGAHHFHVAVGILAELWLVSRLLGGLTEYRAVAVRAVGWYWHFVNVVAVLVTVTVLSPSL
jgi:heme/copper-type cytochrome/quinol oxidase subunit 3